MIPAFRVWKIPHQIVRPIAASPTTIVPAPVVVPETIEVADDPELDDIDVMLQEYDERQEKLLRFGLLDHDRFRVCTVQGGSRVTRQRAPAKRSCPRASSSRCFSSSFRQEFQRPDVQVML